MNGEQKQPVDITRSGEGVEVKTPHGSVTLSHEEWTYLAGLAVVDQRFKNNIAAVSATACKWCGTSAPADRVPVGDLEYHPKCAIDFYRGCVERLAADNARLRAELAETEEKLRIAQHNYKHEAEAFYAFREELIGPVCSLNILDPSALLDEVLEALGERDMLRAERDETRRERDKALARAAQLSSELDDACAGFERAELRREEVALLEAFAPETEENDRGTRVAEAKVPPWHGLREAADVCKALAPESEPPDEDDHEKA